MIMAIIMHTCMQAKSISCTHAYPTTIFILTSLTHNHENVNSSQDNIIKSLYSG